MVKYSTSVKMAANNIELPDGFVDRCDCGVAANKVKVLEPEML
jgi:hypothetical protein